MDPHGRRPIPTAGDGWYFVARPAEPAPPIELEQTMAAAELADTEHAWRDAMELRMVEGELPSDDPDGDLLYAALQTVEVQLGAIDPSARNSGMATYYADRFDGPVIDAWRETLTPVDDRDTVMNLRRVQRLVRDHTMPEDTLREIYHDPEGRYVVVYESRRPWDEDSAPWFVAEWPRSLEAVDHWTERTIIAADYGHVTTFLALTPTDDGQMRVDPIPHPGPDPGFAYGYGGGTPAGTYTALIRCVTRSEERVAPADVFRDLRHVDWKGVSRLWDSITETKGPLRIPWPQLQEWVQQDLRTMATGHRDG